MGKMAEEEGGSLRWGWAWIKAALAKSSLINHLRTRLANGRALGRSSSTAAASGLLGFPRSGHSLSPPSLAAPPGLLPAPSAMPTPDLGRGAGGQGGQSCLQRRDDASGHLEDGAHGV